jgi:hypothetical protein
MQKSADTDATQDQMKKGLESTRRYQNNSFERVLSVKETLEFCWFSRFRARIRDRGKKKNQKIPGATSLCIIMFEAGWKRESMI